MSVLTETAPKRIWLCVSDDLDDYNMPYPELYAEDAEITWSTDQPVAVTIEYVRVDLSENAKLRAERDDFYSDYRMKCDKETKVLHVECDALRHDIERHVAIAAELAAAREHNIRLIEAINRLHEIAQGMWDGSESEIADIINSALAGDKP